MQGPFQLPLGLPKPVGLVLGSLKGFCHFLWKKYASFSWTKWTVDRQEEGKKKKRREGWREGRREARIGKRSIPAVDLPVQSFLYELWPGHR